jgi:16S rRNA (guanine966-N2)-methyltransferase
MRIIAGTKRGMNLFSPDGMVSRPITDRVKESLFDVLQKYDTPGGAVVADLFCGVGSLGLEAASRGAEFVTFIEQDRDIAKTLKRNIEKAGFIARSKVIQANVFSAAATLSDSGAGRCNLIFVDPPYVLTAALSPDSPVTKLMELLSDKVSDNGIVILRTASKSIASERYGRLKLAERRQWGTMACWIYKKLSVEL